MNGMLLVLKHDSPSFVSSIHDDVVSEPIIECVASSGGRYYRRHSLGPLKIFPLHIESCFTNSVSSLRSTCSSIPGNILVFIGLQEKDDEIVYPV